MATNDIHPTTQIDDVPGTATVGEIVKAGGAPEGAARPLPKYLHALSFDDTYIADARAWYETHGGAVGGCSAVRKDGLLGRNYDWGYGEAAEFVVRVSAKEGRHASVGVASLGSELTEATMCSEKYSPLYRVLPGMTLDGINDAGVVAEINVIPRDATKDPVKGGTRDLHALEVVRYSLDNFDTALAAATYVAAHYYIPDGAYSYHWMIADANGTYVVEDGEVIDTETTMTNYRVGVEDDPYGTGYARRELLQAEGPVAELLESVAFTGAYAEGWPWPDEFAAEGVGAHGDAAALRAWADTHVTPHLDPTTRKPAARDGILWQTVHSSIYDFAARTLSVAVQEDFDTRFVFAVERNWASSVSWGEIGGDIDDQEDLAEKFDEKADKSTVYTKSETDAKIVANVENSTGSTSTTKALSANMGRELQEQIQNLKQRGRYLSIWDCTTGLAKTEPTVNPYEYKAGDYFIIGTVGTTNYRPSGTEYDKTVASTVVETGSPIVNDTYYYDGTSWSLLHTEQPTVSWGSVAGKPSEFPPSAHTHTKSQITDFPTPVAPSTSAAQGAFADAKLTAQQLANKQDAIQQLTAALVAWLAAFKGTDTATTLASVLTAIANKQDAISDLASIRLGASAGSAALQRQYEGLYTALIEWDLDSDQAPFLQLIGAPLIIGGYRAATVADLAAYLPDATPAYSASATYAVGAFVKYRGAIYCCKTVITVAESWTPAHWTALPKVADFFSESNTQLTNRVNALIDDKVGDINDALDELNGEVA